MAIIDIYAVAFEHGVHLTDDGGAAGFDAVVGKHGVNVICEYFVRVDDVLVGVHGA